MALKPLDRIPLVFSLRTQLVLITSMLIAPSIAVTSLVAICLRAQMVHQLDEEMKSSAPSLVQLATVRPSGNQEQSLSTYRLYLLDRDGNVLYSLKSEGQRTVQRAGAAGLDRREGSQAKRGGGHRQFDGQLLRLACARRAH